MLPCMSFRTIELFVFWASFFSEFIKIFQVLDTRYVFECFAVSSSYLCSFMTSNRIPSLYCLCSLFFYLIFFLSYIGVHVSDAIHSSLRVFFYPRVSAAAKFLYIIQLSIDVVFIIYDLLCRNPGPG